MKRILLTALAAALLLPAVSFSQGSEGLKTRFRERLPALNELKDQGVIGENNRGFVEFLGQDHRGRDVVDAENADRRELYGAIAASTGTTPELVGQRRALQIVAEERPGRMLQNEAGQWYRKS